MNRHHDCPKDSLQAYTENIFAPLRFRSPDGSTKLN